MKRFLIVLFLFFFALTAYAQQDVRDTYEFQECMLGDEKCIENIGTVWCEPSVAHMSESDRLQLGVAVTSFDLTCECWGGNIAYTSEWIDSYCEDNEIGEMTQQRSKKEKIRPYCSQVVQFTEYQTIDREYCKKCDNPVVVSPRYSVGCVGQFEIFQSSIVAEMYDEKVDICHKKNMALVEHAVTDKCLNPVTSFTTTEGFAGGSIGFILVIVIIGALYFRSR